MCRIAHAREWSTRILHEMEYHHKSVFITLTYDDKHLPSFASLDIKELQKFWKRLRKKIDPVKIMYYACGEYGDEKSRPHYHAIVFGLSLSEDDQISIQAAWPNGSIYCGTVTYDSARYVADYIQKKYSGHKAEEVYDKTNRERPFSVMSRGIGRKYLTEHNLELLQNPTITIHGAQVGIPRYYQKLMRLSTNYKMNKALEIKDIQRAKFIKFTKGHDAEAAFTKRLQHGLQKEIDVLARSKMYKKGSL